MVRRLLLVDPNKRYTPEQALNHQWIVNNTMDQTIPDITENLKNFDRRSVTGIV